MEECFETMGSVKVLIYLDMFFLCDFGSPLESMAAAMNPSWLQLSLSLAKEWDLNVSMATFKITDGVYSVGESSNIMSG